MSDSGGGGLCLCCLKFFLAAGLSALVLWLLYRPITPRYYLISLSLNSTSLPLPPGNLTANVTVASFQLEVENKNREMGISHDPITLSLNLSSGRNVTAPAAVVPAFYQGHQKTAEKGGGVVAGGGGGSRWPAVVRVTVESAFRYKVLAWRTRRHRVSLAAEVAVGSDGTKTAKKGIRLRSAAPAERPVGLVIAVLALFCWL